MVDENKFVVFGALFDIIKDSYLNIFDTYKSTNEELRKNMNVIDTYLLQQPKISIVETDSKIISKRGRSISRSKINKSFT